MKADNDNEVALKTLDGLPLFATDQEIAVAVVGQNRAAKWLREALPSLKKMSGFPPDDKLHGGRSTALLAKFYHDYVGLSEGYTRPDGEERMDLWRKRKTRRRSV